MTIYFDQPHKLGTSIYKNVQTSTTDTTEDRVMLTGAFGLGTNLVYSTDDQSYYTQTYVVSIPGSSTVAVPIPSDATDVLVRGWTNGTGTVTGFKGRFLKSGGTWTAYNLYGVTGSSNHPSITVVGNVPHFQNNHASTYEFSWIIEAVCQNGGNARILFGSEAIVGAVSVSSGIPTGAIIESGSNGSGEYIKYTDGTMICTRLYTTTTSITSASAVHGFSNSADLVWTFPAAFSDVPSVTASGREFSCNVGLRTVTASNTTFRVTSFSIVASATRYINFIAIGRWF